MSVKNAIEVLPTLKKLSKLKNKKARNKILSSCPCRVVTVLSDISRNVLNGSIKVPKTHLHRLRLYKKDLRKLSAKVPTKTRRKVLIQKGGFLPFLLIPALTLLATYIGQKLAKK